jgi:chromosome segregation ATPase
LRKVKELEGTKDDLMKKLEDDKQRFIKTANYIKQLEEKNQNAERLYSDAARKSELNSEEIERLKSEMDKERRKSVSLEQTFLPKIHLLVDENQALLREIESLKQRVKQADDKIAELTDHLNKSKQAIQYLEDESRNKDRAIGDLQRAVSQEGYRNQQKLNEAIEEKNRVVQATEAELNRTRQEREGLSKALHEKSDAHDNQRNYIAQLERILGERDRDLLQ